MKKVFIAGSFDGLHIGHINILKRAKELGDYLIVALNTDDYLARKGPGRPLDILPVRTKKIFAANLADDIFAFESQKGAFEINKIN